MATVTILPTILHNYHAGDNNAEIRIYSTSSFFQGGKEQVGGGKYFYTSIPCVVAGTDVGVPEFTLPSTTDSTDDTVRYIAEIYSSKGQFVATLMEGAEFSLPPLSPTTWQSILVNTKAVARRLPTTYYTAQQVDFLLAGLIADSAPPGIVAWDAVNAESPTEISLTWEAATGDHVTGYELRMKATASQVWGTANDLGNVLVYYVSGLTPSTSYDFQIRAYKASGARSSWNPVITSTTPSV